MPTSLVLAGDQCSPSVLPSAVHYFIPALQFPRSNLTQAAEAVHFTLHSQTTCQPSPFHGLTLPRLRKPSHLHCPAHAQLSPCRHSPTQAAKSVTCILYCQTLAMSPRTPCHGPGIKSHPIRFLNCQSPTLSLQRSSLTQAAEGCSFHSSQPNPSHAPALTLPWLDPA